MAGAPVTASMPGAAARASYVIMETLPQKNITAVMTLPSAAEMWEKLANGNAAVSPSFATLARTTFHGFKILNGESVIKLDVVLHHNSRDGGCQIPQVHR